MPRLTVKGQVTVPKEIRDALGIRPGSEVVFEFRDGEAVLRRRVADEACQRWVGYLRGKTPFERTDELVEELRGR